MIRLSYSPKWLAFREYLQPRNEGGREGGVERWCSVVVFSDGALVCAQHEVLIIRLCCCLVRFIAVPLPQ